MAELRVSGGELRGRRFAGPKGGAEVRPTTERVREAMTAAALLTVVGVALAMQKAGLSASLGAFIAGALLAESSYRHQLEADIQPFQGILLGSSSPPSACRSTCG